MDYGYTEEQKMIKDLCRQIGEEKIKPVREEYDETGEFPWDLMKVFIEADLPAIAISEEYGGMGGTVMDGVVAVEELSKYCGGITLEEQAQIIARARGGRGPNTEYLINTTQHLTELGISDSELEWLVNRVAQLNG